MGLIINGIKQAKPIINGTPHNAILDGKKVWIEHNCQNMRANFPDTAVKSLSIRPGWSSDTNTLYLKNITTYTGTTKIWNFSELTYTNAGTVTNNILSSTEGSLYPPYPVILPTGSNNGFNLNKIGDWISYDIMRTGSTTRWQAGILNGLVNSELISHFRDIDTTNVISHKNNVENSCPSSIMINDYTNIKWEISSISNGYLYFKVHVNNVLQ